MGKRLKASSIIQRLIETDGLIEIERIEAQQPQIYRQVEYLYTLAHSLWPNRYSIFMSGSRALALRSGDRELLFESGGQSDVDIWLVVSGPPVAGMHPDSAIWQRLPYLAHYDMVVMPWTAPLPFSIKILGFQAAQRAFSLQNQAPTVLRTASLVSRKPVDQFYGFKAVYEHVTREQARPEGYVWTWESVIFENDDLVLTDLLSFVMLGGFLVDHLGLAGNRLALLRELRQQVATREAAPGSNPEQFFGYLLSKFPVAFDKLT